MSDVPALALEEVTCRFAGRDGGGAYTAVAKGWWQPRESISGPGTCSRPMR
jgi:hypothetical protein